MEIPAKMALIIDDDPDICSLLEQILKYRHLTVSITGSLSGTQSILNERCPDFIFLDHRLPDGLGLDFIPTLRKSCPFARIIAMTAQDQPEQTSHVLKSAYDYLLQKPFFVDKIYELVDNLT